MYSRRLLKLAKLIKRLVVIGFKLETEFRTDFLFSMVQFLLYNALFFTFWQAILGRASNLDHWTIGELIVFTFVAAFQRVLYIPFLGLHRLPESVVKGELDKYLCRPVSPLFMLSFETIHIVEFIRRAVVTAVSIAFSIWHFDLTLSTQGIFLAAIVLIIGNLILVFANGLVSMLSFWTGTVKSLGFLLGISNRFDRYPIDIFPNSIRFTLTWIFPVSLIATYPTMILLGKPVDLTGILFVALALFAIWGGLFVFVSRKSLARYEAFGG